MLILTHSSGAASRALLRARATVSPNALLQGTGLPFAGTAAAPTLADAGVVAAVLGSPSRGAPV